jgi:hypothetical protein
LRFGEKSREGSLVCVGWVVHLECHSLAIPN